MKPYNLAGHSFIDVSRILVTRGQGQHARQSEHYVSICFLLSSIPKVGDAEEGLGRCCLYSGCVIGMEPWVKETPILWVGNCQLCPTFTWKDILTLSSSLGNIFAFHPKRYYVSLPRPLTVQIFFKKQSRTDISVLYHKIYRYRESRIFYNNRIQ